MICSNELTIYFGGQTIVDEIEDTDLIPLHSFEFINFKDLRSRCDDTSFLTGRFFWNFNIRSKLDLSHVYLIIFLHVLL